MAVRIRKPVKPQFDSVRAFLFERSDFRLYEFGRHNEPENASKLLLIYHLRLLVGGGMRVKEFAQELRSFFV